MQNIINFTGHYSICHLHNIKKQSDIAVSKPVQNYMSQNVSFKGTEALAAYNYSLVHQNELFNLPVIRPMDIPINSENINGEKIFDSDGNISRIINKDNEREITYYFRRNGFRCSVTKEQDSDIKWVTNYYDDNNIEVIKVMPDGTEYSTHYEDGEPIQNSKYKMDSKGNTILMDHFLKEKTYLIRKSYTENGKQYSSFVEYDSNKQCTYASETEGMFDETTDLYFMNGLPYGITTTKSKSLSTQAGKNDIDLTNLEPAPFYEIDMNKINSIEGVRKYYTNGQIDKIISTEGDIYIFEPEGILSTIQSKNKEIQFEYSYRDNKIHGQHITETMPNGGIKKTYYDNSPKDSFSVWYEDVDYRKYVLYNDKGNIISYSNEQKGIKEIARDYDDNGNLIRCWDELLDADL